MKLRQLKLADLLRSEHIKYEEIWVLNRTSETEPKPGTVIFTVKVDGDETAVTVPSTWIPINLTDQVPADILAAAPNFRKVVNSGRLTIHVSEDCVKFMNDQDARRELSRINETSQQIQNVVNTGEFEDGVKIDVASEAKETEMKIDNRIASLAAAKELGDPKALGVLFLVFQLLNDEETDAVTKMNSLRINLSKMNKSDLKYIMERSEDENIQVWAGKMLSKMLSEDESIAETKEAMY